ncbi:MAG: DHH family phosphoesterase [Nanoarchaeota archaeon]|nr:DHH family phosphoesterase [Nanoarchaeota archaeon]
MLTKKQIVEIREHLERAQNPIFFFDNDADGVCSFLLLQKYLGRGKGVPIKSFPDFVEDYFRKVKEFEADYIFILDKPVVSDKFFEEAERAGVNVVWIDHHLVDKKNVPSYVHYYNPLFNKKKSCEPVTALCYQIADRIEDLWILVAGCVSDRFVPEEYSDFERKYPDLALSSRDPFDIYYKSPIGKIAKMINFGLKDRTTNVMNMLRFLLGAGSPYEVLEETPGNQTMHYRYKQVDSKYKKLLQKAISSEGIFGKLVFFQYRGDLSISGDLSNELSYLFKDKIIVVLYNKGSKVNISMRGKGVRELFRHAIEGIDGARGGGHENAIGGQLNSNDVERFRERLEAELK